MELQETKKERTRVFGIIIIMALSSIGLYGLPYMRDQFYDIMIEAFQLSHSEISVLFSIFGTVSLFSYILGGPVVDYFSTKKLMCLSLLASGALHLYVLTIPSFITLCFIFGGLALTACFAFYPASMKLLNSLQEEGKKGKVFGTYVSFIGIMGTWVVLIGIVVLNLNAPALQVFQIVVGSYGLLNLIMCVLLFILVDETKITGGETRKVEWSMVPKIANNRRLWCVAGIMFLNYLGAATMTYLVPFLSTEYMLAEKYIVVIAVLRTNVNSIIASATAGIIADKLKSAVKLHRIVFGVGGLASIVLLWSSLHRISVIIIVLVALMYSFVEIGAKSVNFVMLSEIKIPSYLFGTAVGMVSFVAFSPDAFFYRIAGFVLDTATKPFVILFSLLMVTMLCGVILSSILLKKMNQMQRL